MTSTYFCTSAKYPLDFAINSLKKFVQTIIPSVRKWSSVFFFLAKQNASFRLADTVEGTARAPFSSFNFTSSLWNSKNQDRTFHVSIIYRRHGVSRSKPKKATEQQMEMDPRAIRLRHNTVRIIRSHPATALRPEVCPPNLEKNWGTRTPPPIIVDWLVEFIIFSIISSCRNSTSDSHDVGRASPERPPSPVLVPGILKSNVAFFENLKRN